MKAVWVLLSVALVALDPGASDRTPIYYHAPAWSPDGSRIAFSSTRDGNADIYTIDPDGGGLIRLTSSDSGEGEPAWSPDGSRIVFTSGGGLDVMDADGGGRKTLVDSPRATAAIWSPDGTKIVFEGRVDDNWDIYAMDLESSEITRLTTDPANDFRPSWSTDGARIVFNSKRASSYDLYVMDADGSDPTRLTDDENHEVGAAWSTSGARLFFEWIESDEKGGLAVLDPDTGAITRLTEGQEREASWSPDGGRVVFVNDAPNGTDLALYIMDADGSNRRMLVGPDR